MARSRQPRRPIHHDRRAGHDDRGPLRALRGRGRATAIVVRQGPTSGDLLVLAVLGFIVIMLGAVGTLAWRETHGTGRQPGMGSGDDPLWSGGDHDGPSWTTDQA